MSYKATQLLPTVDEIFIKFNAFKNEHGCYLINFKGKYD